jgi:plastocyanin
VLSAAACGSSSGPTGTDNPPPPPPASGDIAIVPGASLLTTTAFNPNPKSVVLGGAASVSVRWVNTDVTGGGGYGGGGGTATAHMIMSDDGAFATSQLLGGGDTYSIELTKAGTYKYHCAVHPNMVGTITVAP